MQARIGRAVAVDPVNRGWVLAARCGPREFCFAGHGASVVASVVGRNAGRARVAGVSAGQGAGSQVVSVAAERGGGAADPRCASPHELWAGQGGGPGRLSPLDGLQGARSAWVLAPAADAAGTLEPAL